MRIFLTLGVDYFDGGLLDSPLGTSEQCLTKVFLKHNNIALKELGQVLQAPFYRLKTEAQRGYLMSPTSQSFREAELVHMSGPRQHHYLKHLGRSIKKPALA